LADADKLADVLVDWIASRKTEKNNAGPA